jgi:hypothetical protein
MSRTAARIPDLSMRRISFCVIKGCVTAALVPKSLSLSPLYIMRELRNGMMQVCVRCKNINSRGGLLGESLCALMEEPCILHEKNAINC